MPVIASCGRALSLARELQRRRDQVLHNSVVKRRRDSSPLGFGRGQGPAQPPGYGQQPPVSPGYGQPSGYGQPGAPGYGYQPEYRPQLPGGFPPIPTAMPSPEGPGQEPAAPFGDVPPPPSPETGE